MTRIPLVQPPHGRRPMGGTRTSVLLAVAMLLQLGVLEGVPADEAGQARLLVGPVSARAGLAEDPFVTAVPALIAEGISGEGSAVASQVHDLPPDAVTGLGLKEGEALDARRLGRTASQEALRDKGAVGMLILPEVSAGKIEGARGYEIEIRWIDLAHRSEGVLRDSGAAGTAAIDAVGRLAAAARTEWKKSRGGDGITPAEPALSGRVSPSPEALRSWAASRSLWNSGDPPAAVASLDEALRIDPAFDLARADLAWIRLAQGRLGEAGALAARALEGRRLSPAALEEAEIVRAAAGGNGQILITLACNLPARAGDSLRAPLAKALGQILLEDYPPAIGLLDRARFHRPNDPALLHFAGIAGLGAADYFEGRERLSRAAELWPTHEVIMTDLAEAYARERDFEGARAVLDGWSGRFRPGDRPGAGESWSVENPPPHVRAAALPMLMGNPRAALAGLESHLDALEASGTGLEARVPVLHALHELQMWLLDDGNVRQRQQMLDGARESLRLLLEEWVTPEERAHRPWLYDRLVARLRVREGRIDEAREIRERILASSGLPGYDPGVEAEVEAVITLKLAETENHLAACRRAIEVRGSLLDRYMLIQAYTMMRDWRALEEEYQVVAQRLADWSAARRGDALLFRPMSSGHLPIIYYTGAMSRLNQGDGNGARERFGAFLNFYRQPDGIFYLMHGTARNNGGPPES